MSEVKNWRIYAGLGGGFGGATYQETINCTEDEANEEAYLHAVNEYESYGGMHGLFNYEDAREENPEANDDELDEMYLEDMDMWIEYWIEEETEENKEKDE